MCDAKFIEELADSFLSSTENIENFTAVLHRLAGFYRAAVDNFSGKKRCTCEYYAADSSAWQVLLMTMYRIVRYLHRNQFDELESLYEVPNEDNAVKAFSTYSIMGIMLEDIDDFELYLYPKLRSFDHSKYELVKRYTRLIKECMLMMSSNYRTICLEKYFGNRSTDRNRIIDCVTNSFGLI